MTHAYREPGLACPSCRGVLRVFGKRLVCDACGGILIATDDLAVELADVGGLNVQVEDGDVVDASCPRCGGPLHACDVVAAGLRFLGLAHCARDGLWIGGDKLGQIIETIFRHEHRGAGLGRFYGGRGPAKGSGLAISRWWDKPRPRAFAPFHSELEGRELPCATCPQGKLQLVGQVWTCPVCQARFVENAVVEAMISELARTPWQLPPPSGAPGWRSCPACARALVTDAIEGVPVERCPDHGLWLGPGELENLLQTSARAEPAPGGWLKRLFRRDDPGKP